MTQLVLSLFPGIGLLDMAFEEAGFCVVRGPDVLWGGDVKHFHPPAGRFDGVIGGPPCKAFTKMRHILVAMGRDLAENLIPEYERCVGEAQPRWFLMENVPDAPGPVVAGYAVHSITVNNRWFKADPDDVVGPEQNRERCFSFGTREGLRLNVSESIALMENPLTVEGKYTVIGNGVPLPMGRAIARAVKAAMEALG